jgi:hypothetical protein
MAAIAVAELRVDGLDVMNPVVPPFSTADAVSARMWTCGGKDEKAAHRKMNKNGWIECQDENEEKKKLW